jgi:exosortase
MVPVPQSIYSHFAFPLQLLASKVSSTLLNLMSIPVFREGNMLHFARTQLEVAEACSGLRSITAYVMLSVLFAYLMKNVWWKKAVLVFLAIPMAFLVNIIRVTGTGVLAHIFGGEIAKGFLHDFSGMVVFALGIVLMATVFVCMQKIDKG